LKLSRTRTPKRTFTALLVRVSSCRQIFTQQETAGALKAQADAVAQEAAVTAGTEKS